MVRFSCANFTFPLLTRTQMLQLLRILEIEAVDLGLFARPTHFPLTEILQEPCRSGLAVRRELEACGLVPADVFLQIGEEPQQFSVNDPDPSVRRQNRRIFISALDFSSSIGCRHITGLPGVWHGALSQKDAVCVAQEETAWRVEAARQAGIIYAVEPHLGSIITTPETVVQFLDGVPGLTLTLDYGHFIASRISSQQVHPLTARASHIHVRGGSPGQLQAPMAENTIDFAGMVQRLEARAYTGYYCLEYVWIDWQGCDRADNISETLLLRRQLQKLAGI
jgi:sugar phosphate isomerase/epimerase